MEDEIKVNEYARDDFGNLFVVIGKYERGQFGEICVQLGDFKTKEFAGEQWERNIKIGNLIDLIEVGDYVNGHKILEIKRNIESGSRYLMYDYVPIKYYVERTDEIKTIATKEMMESIIYIVKE